MKETTNNCPVPGWKRIVCQRKTGRTAGKFDVHFLNPDGKTLRSRREISRNLKENGIDVSLELFCFRADRNEHESALTNVKDRTKQGTQSGYFDKGGAQLETRGASMDIGSSSNVKEKNSTMKQDCLVNKQETTTHHSDSQADENIVQHAKIQTSPYFKRNCSSPKAKPVSMDEDSEKKTHFESSHSKIVSLPSIPLEFPSLSPKRLKILNNYGKETTSLPSSNITPDLVCLPNQKLSKDFDNESSELPNSLSPRPLRMNIYDKEVFSDKFSTSTLVRLPAEGLSNDSQTESSGLKNYLSPKPLITQESAADTSMVALSNRGEPSKEFMILPTVFDNPSSPKVTLKLNHFTEETMPTKPLEKITTTLPAQEPTSNDFQSLPPGLQKFYTLQYTPPKSPFNLIQEEIYKDPWKLLVATIFLNRTGGKNAIPILWTFFEQFPDAGATSNADPTQIEDIIQPLGLFRKRAQILIRFSTEFLSKAWHCPSELYGIGKYGNDSFRIFCLGEYKDVLPDDHKLNLYHGWLCERDREGLDASIL